MIWDHLKKLIFILLILESKFVAAAAIKTTYATKLGYIQKNFTGQDKLSFSDGSPSYGLELKIQRGGKYLKYFLKTIISKSIGSQNFIKSGTTYFSKYEYSSVETELGVMFFPVGVNDNGASVYLWGAGGLSYGNLFIKSIPTTIDVNAKAQESGFGYSGGLGVELYILNRGKNGITVYCDIGLSDYRIPLAGLKNFEVSGITFSLGLGF